MVKGETIDIDIKWLKESKKSIEWDRIDEKYREPLRKFYEDMLFDLERKGREKEGLKPGNQSFKSQPFEERLKELFKEILGDRADVGKAKLNVKDEYRDCLRPKGGKSEIDIKITGKGIRRQVFYLEIKYSLDLDRLGSALVRAITLDREKDSKFYVISFYEKGRESKAVYYRYRELCKKKPFSDYIDGVICFGPYDPELKDVIKLLKEVDENV